MNLQAKAWTHGLTLKCARLSRPPGPVGVLELVPLGPCMLRTPAGEGLDALPGRSCCVPKPCGGDSTLRAAWLYWPDTARDGASPLKDTE